MSEETFYGFDFQELNQLANKIVEGYPLTSANIKLLTISENVTFRIDAKEGRFSLRLHRPFYHRRHQIESELLWLEELRKVGLEVPAPLRNCQDELVTLVPVQNAYTFNAVIFHWMEGEQLDTSIKLEHYEQLGAMTALIHQHSRSWQKPEGFSRIVWNFDSMVGNQGHWGSWREHRGLTPADHQLIDQVLTQVSSALKEYGQSAQRFGLIHADLRLTNILLEDNKVKAIDFDDCGVSWYMHDLPAAISFHESHPQAVAWVDAWLTGYQRHLSLDEADFKVLPALFIQRRLQLVAWSASHYQTAMARSVGEAWIPDTLALCHRFLEKPDKFPIGPM